MKKKQPKLEWVDKPHVLDPIYPRVDKRELINLDHCFRQFIVPRLKAYRKNPYGHPGKLTEKEWKHILDEMIFGFEFCLSSFIFGKNYARLRREAKGSVFDHPEVKAAEKRALKGRILFAKWFGALWQ